MDIVLMKNFLMDLFRFMKKFPAVTDDNWDEIIKYSNLIADKYKRHKLVKKFLLAYMDYIDEKEKR